MRSPSAIVAQAKATPLCSPREPWTIGETALASGVPAETIRFYEKQGLLRRASRSGGGYRQYLAEDVQRLRFIRRAKDLGFSLKDIAELLELRDGGAGAASFKEVSLRKVADIDARLVGLRRLREGLAALAEQCHGDDTRPCPILHALEGECDAPPGADGCCSGDRTGQPGFAVAEPAADKSLA